MDPATILHADLDAFYASVEQLLDPSLRGRPIAVGGGVVLAASYEAKAFGVRGGMAGRRARELCPDLIFVGGHFKEYQRLGDAAIAVLDDFTPLVERISIDEAFADVAGCTHLFGSPEAIAPRSPPAGPRRARPADLGRRRPHQAPRQDRLAGRQARRAGGGRSRGRTRLPPRSAGRADVGRRPGDAGAPRRERHHHHRPARRDLAAARVARLLGKAAGEKLHRARLEPRPAGDRHATGAPIRPAPSRRSAGSRSTTSSSGRRSAISPTASRAGSAPSRARGRTVTVRVRFADLRAVTRSVSLAAPVAATAILAEVAEDLVRAALRDHPRGAGDLAPRHLGVASRSRRMPAARVPARPRRREAAARQRGAAARASSPTAPSTRSATVSAGRRWATPRSPSASANPCPTVSASSPRRSSDAEDPAPSRRRRSGEVGAGAGDEVAHVHAAACAVVGVVLPRLDRDRPRADIAVPEAEDRAAGLAGEDVGAVQDRLRRRVGAVDAGSRPARSAAGRC